ncbi:hypothetical protein V5E97_31820 [Singulisphaera sp. Ch08]|uniref:Uncharacterized protein n=1 Tax=Singulisphaera sp. Ch08 TaxID=3120278 RepID=A0AAU7CDU1_9BACT
MKPHRLTIANIMVAVLFIAIAGAALRDPTRLWASALFTLTVALLCWASSMALLKRDQRRIFWAGVAIFGWVHLSLSFGLMSGDKLSRPPLLYELLVAEFQFRIMPHTLVISGSLNGTITGRPNGGVPNPFLQIGLTLANLLVALIGGFLVRTTCPNVADSPE